MKPIIRNAAINAVPWWFNSHLDRQEGLAEPYARQIERQMVSDLQAGARRCRARTQRAFVRMLPKSHALIGSCSPGVALNFLTMRVERW